MKYWNINGYGYQAIDTSEALSKYAKDFLEKTTIRKSEHIVITRVTKKEFDSYT